jgi:hypothetical protein
MPSHPDRVRANNEAEDMRSIRIFQRENGKYVTQFIEGKEVKWFLEAYMIISHEMMVEWIEKSSLPAYVGVA